MTSDWANNMESMNTEEDNSDLFGVDLFSDELLDMYNSSNGDGTTTGSSENLTNEMLNNGYSELGELKSSPSMNDFTSILEEGHTPVKPVDSMLLTKSTSHSSGKKRSAATQHSNTPAKKRTNSKTSSKAGTKGNATSNGRRTTSNANNAQKNMLSKSNGDASTVNNNAKIKKEVTNVTSSPIAVNTQSSAQQTVTSQPTKVQPIAQPIAGVHVPSQATSQVTNSNVVKANRVVATAGKTSPISSKVSVSSVKTEESFKGVAQAAVNNLILSAGQTSTRFESTKSDNSYVKQVDTSTAHVAALTSTNWVAACAASISDAPPGTAEAAQAAALAAASDPAAAKAARARRASLTADERARQNRDRNREHARNTRLRKKAYVEELKRTLTELVTARDAADLERRHEKQRDLEVREVRFRVMEEFLKLRARGSESNLLARWNAILEDGFSLTIPRTDYRGMVNAQNNQMSRQVSNVSVFRTADINDPTVQVLKGPTECFDDASKIAVFLQSLSPGSIIQTYNCDRKKFMMDGINAMLEWTVSVTTNEDSSPIIILKGCMRATFSPASNKLVCAELLFDSGSVVNQVKSLVSYQDVTDALLDSVLPQAQPAQATKQDGVLPCSVSVVSADKESSSDDECLNRQQQQQSSEVKQEQK
jgi:hypothetical protein